jgi:hypothetical protein
MSDNHDDDDVPQLSAETFSALSEFYKEQVLRPFQQQFVSTIGCFTTNK